MSMNIHRGSIYMASLPITKNSSVQGGFRPVLVVQNNTGNTFSPTVQVIPLTSRIKRDLPIHTTIIGHGLDKESTILTEQMQTIDKTALKQYIGRVDDDTMEKVNVCIMIQLGIFVSSIAH